MYQKRFLLVPAFSALVTAQLAQPKNPLACSIAGFDYNTAMGSGAVWRGKPFLHAWIGAYYNGTVSVKASFAKGETNCTAQEEEYTAELPGVFSVISPQYLQGIGRKDEFVYLLQAWDEDADLFAEPRLRGMPLGVRVDLRSVPEFHVGSIVSNTMASCSMTTETKEKDLDFNCDYRWDQNVSLNDPFNVTTADDSYVRLADIPTCEDNAKSEMVFANFENTTAAMYDEELNDTLASRHPTPMATGKFNTDSAEFTLKGPFEAKLFQDWDKKSNDERWNVLYAMNGNKLKGLDAGGTMEVSFKGKIDAENSHGIEIKEGGQVEFKEDLQKSEKMEKRLIHPCFYKIPKEAGGLMGTEEEEAGSSGNGGSGGSGGSESSGDAGKLRVGGWVYVVVLGVLAALI